jgi:hypothetical protein
VAIAPYELTMRRQLKGQDMRAFRLDRNGLTRWLADGVVCFAVYCGAAAWPTRALAQDVLRAAPYPVGMTHLVKKPRTMPGLSS